MPDWSVKIVITKSGETEFIPDFPNAQQGQPLEAEQSDLVSWNNETNDAHQPWETYPDYTPTSTSNLMGSVPAGQPSDNYSCEQPPGSPNNWTLYYCCATHPNNPLERGSITVTALPDISVNIIDTGAGANFVPQARNTKSGKLLNWNNQTGEAHQPWPTDQNYQKLPVSPGSSDYLSDPIPAGGTSKLYKVNPPDSNPTAKNWTVYYFCNLHPDEESERGTIVVPPSG